MRNPERALSYALVFLAGYCFAWWQAGLMAGGH